MNKKWRGICMLPTNGFTRDQTYEVVEIKNSTLGTRPVKVVNDQGKECTMFAARFMEDPEGN